MIKDRIEFDDPTFRPAKRSDADWDALMATAIPFARVANIIDTLPEWTDADLPLRGFMPSAWPTVGDARKLRDELVRLGWKP